jgi:AcrR family transcriptional regulator
MTSRSAKPRGRPRQSVADQQAMRQRIIVAARRLFLRDGVEAVSMRNLAAEVGCSPMALYRYFANKQEILWQVWDVFLDELFTRLQQVQADRPRERLARLAQGYLDYWLDYPERFLIVFLQPDLEPGGTRRYLESGDIVRRFALFTDTVVAAQAAGELGAGPAEAIAQGLICAVQGLALNFITIPDYPWHDRSAVSALVVRSYLAGVPGTS